MTFFNTIKEFESFNPDEHFSRVTDRDILESIQKEKLGISDFLNLISPEAENFLEPMAARARETTIQYFGRVIQLFAPLYISDFCTNRCTYCGFNIHNRFKRKKLTSEQIDKQAGIIKKSGIRHILVLTGEDPVNSSVSYLEQAVEVLSHHFASIGLEVYPMDTPDYEKLVAAGADSLTVYQEVYDRDIYRRVHPAGRKSDYPYRLSTPERACRAGFRSVNIGALFGLAPVRTEAFFTGLHAKYLEDRYPEVEISVSLPRMTKACGCEAPACPLGDKTFVQFMTALRLFLPKAGITVSTREPARLRDRLVHLGATRLSAGSKTQVGGYSREETSETPQFETTDTRSVDQVEEMILQSGYQPVFKDWEPLEAAP
ncbi:MAG: 2-iminoacetate synthase ThiH [Desulfobacteraceae bacterium]